MNLYLENGYLNFPKLREFAKKHNIKFVYIVGARGIGKTYGAVESFLVSEPSPFLFMRRTQKQADIIGNPRFSPFTKPLSKHGKKVLLENIDKVDGVKSIHVLDVGDDEDDPGPVMGYTCALSTFSNVRGFNADENTDIVFDEFIPEKHEHPIKNEAEAFFNAYESINRNRELEDPPRPAVTAFCLANSNDLGNPIFMFAGHVQTCLNMRKKHQDVFIDFKRHYMIIMPEESPISEGKKNTVLYEYLGTDNTFSDMSLSNIFKDEKDVRTISRPLKEYRPIVTVGELTIYKHKANERPLYGTFHRSGSCPVYGGSDTELKRFSGKYCWLWNAYMLDRVEFEDYGAQLLFERYFK